MSLSLNAHMDMVMKHGVDLLRSHQQQIIAECTGILQYLRETHKGSADAFEFAFNCFVAFFRSGQQSVETLIDDIRSQWVKEFHRPPEPHVLIFILTLIENSVHKAIKEVCVKFF
ncbi:helix-turn-helix transcriptional regulator, partial [Heyndrickxia faecalis]